MRRPLIAGNWKMHKTIAEARSLVVDLLATDCFDRSIDVVVAPPFTALAAVSAVLGETSPLGLAGQTMHWGDQGAYTGEISGPMLVDVGCRYVILGHSERRAMSSEGDEAINRQVKAALGYGLTPIVAVGETLEEHKAGRAKERVMSQTLAALDGLSDADLCRCTLAYEPIWAIGTGLAEDPQSANDVMGAIRSCFPTLEGCPILYGGSVKPANAAALFAQPNIDGALVGGASLEAISFAAIVRHACDTVAAG